MPFRRQVGYWTCVVIGRWIGGLLGYKPFFREYTTDWDYAVAKMKGSFFQRHLVNGAYASQQSWAGQEDLEAPSKPENAEYELWTTDIDPRPLDLGPVGYEKGLWNANKISSKDGGLVHRNTNGVKGSKPMDQSETSQERNGYS